MRPTNLFLVSVVACCCHAVCAEEPVGLWSGRQPVPEVKDIPLIDQELVRYRTVYRSEKPYTFSIGAAVTYFDGRWRVSWAANPDGVKENGGSEFVRESVSEDGGTTWSEPQVLAPALKGKKFHSHGSYHPHDGKLYFLAKRGPWTDGHAKVFELNQDTGTWTERGAATIDEATFWPMDTPMPLDNGNWIMGGLSGENGRKAAVAIAKDGNPNAWVVQTLPGPSEGFGETTVITRGMQVVAISRDNKVRGAAVRWSQDGGVTWSDPVASAFPMGTSKPYAGRLADGRPFLVCNRGGRGSLELLLGKPGAMSFDRIWKLRPGKPAEARFKGPNHKAQWAYPYAHEHDGELFIVHHSAKEDVEMISIPLAALK